MRYHWARHESRKINYTVSLEVQIVDHMLAKHRAEAALTHICAQLKGVTNDVDFEAVLELYDDFSMAAVKMNH